MLHDVMSDGTSVRLSPPSTSPTVDAQRRPDDRRVANPITATALPADPNADRNDPAARARPVDSPPAFHWRPITGLDRPLVEALLVHELSETSRARRFATPMPTVEARIVDLLCSADGRRHVALAVMEDDRLVAMGRYVRCADNPSTADVAITVADRCQGRGIGTEMIATLARIGSAGGLQSFEFAVHGDNRAAQRLLRRFGVILSYEGGLGHAVVPVRALVTSSVRSARPTLSTAA